MLNAEGDHTALVATSLSTLDWLAPGVREGILSLDWASASPDSVATFCAKVIPDGDTRFSRLLKEAPFLDELVAELLQRGALENRLGHDGEYNLFTRLSMCCSDGRDPAFRLIVHSYFLLFLEALALLAEDEHTQTALRIAAVTSNLQNGLANHSADSALVTLGSFLSLDQIHSKVTPEQLAIAVRQRVGPSRSGVRSTFFNLLINALNKADLRRHAITVGNLFFDNDSVLSRCWASADSITSLVKRVEAYEESQVETILSNAKHVEVGIICHSCFAIASEMFWATRALINSGASDAGEISGQLDVFLDAVVGLSLKAPLDFGQIDYLLSRNARDPVFGCLSNWIDSLIWRDVFDGFLAVFVTDVRMVLGEPLSPRSWWQAPGAIGRTAVLADVFNKLAESRGEHNAFQFLLYCFGDDKVANCLGSIAAESPSPAHRRISMCLAFCFAYRLYNNGHFGHALATLEQPLCSPPIYDTSYDPLLMSFRVENNVHDVERFAVALSAIALARQGDLLLARGILESICGSFPPDPNFTLDRIDSIDVIQSDFKMHVLGAVCVVCHAFGTLHALLPVFQRELRFPDHRTSTNHELSVALRGILRSRGQALAAQAAQMELVAAYAHSVGYIDGYFAAARVWEAVLGTEDLEDSEIASAFSDDDVGAVCVAATQMAVPFLALGRFGRYLAIAGQVFEHDSTGEPDWFRVKCTLRASRECGPWIINDFFLAISSYVIVSFSQSGQRQRACELAFTHLRDSSWLERGSEERGCDGAILLGSEIARLLVYDRPEVVERIQGQLIELASDVHGFSRTSSIERIWGAGRSSGIRRFLVELGNSLSVAQASGGGRSRIRNLVYDDRLAQQTLMLRFLQGQLVVAITPGPALEPGRNRMATKHPTNRKARRKRSSATRLDQRCGLVPAQGYDLTPRDSGRSLVAEDFASWSETPSEQQVADALGIGCVLLRAGFSVDGRLVWSLFRTNGESVDLVGNDEGTGTPEDRSRILDALHRFERQADAAWDLYEVQSVADSVDGSWLSRLKAVVLDGESVRPRNDRLYNQVALILEQAPSIWKRFRVAFPEAEACGVPNNTVAAWEDWWRDTLADFAVVDSCEFNLQSALDDATESFIRSIEAVWPLHEMCQPLGRDDELVVWVDDALLGVPLPFLHCIGDDGVEKHLFERVDSIRSIVSTQLDAWMASNDTQVRSGTVREPAIIVSVSSFENASEREQRVEDRLARQFSQLAARHSDLYEWRMAGGRSGVPGSHDVLARGLADAKDRRVALLTVCAHGHDEPQGVQLGDGVWDGSEVWSPETDEAGNIRWGIRGACDLSQVDFLIQLSCSIGRLHQSGLQDVHGFCAELFLNRVRSVFAGRWPLHAAESIHLAGWVARSYLKRHASATAASVSLHELRARGRSVAAARRHWARLRRIGVATVSLNTMAGMELYGLS